MGELARPLTVSFTTTGVGRVTEKFVLDAVRRIISTNDMKALQFTPTECRITALNNEALHRLKSSSLRVNNKELWLTSVVENVSNLQM